MARAAARLTGAGERRERLGLATGTSLLGAVLVAASDSGIAAILIGDDPEALEQDLRGRFPDADLLESDEAAALLPRVIALLDDSSAVADLPLDPRGTSFQRRVWAALREVPAGRTVTYGDLAQAVGAPAAVRAVAGACAANPLAVAVPCHRVVGADGRLTGYRWGLPRKRALLAREAGLSPLFARR